MAMREAIEGEIRELKGKILELETQLMETTDREEKLLLLGLLTSKQNALNIEKQRLLQLEQQGKSSRISIIPSQSSRCNPLPNIFRHLLFTHSIRRLLLKVRGDGYYCSVDVQCSMKCDSRTKPLFDLSLAVFTLTANHRQS